jgi:hypothetical protein
MLVSIRKGRKHLPGAKGLAYFVSLSVTSYRSNGGSASFLVTLEPIKKLGFVPGEPPQPCPKCVGKIRTYPSGPSR